MSDLSDDEIWSLCKLGYQLYCHGRLEDARTIFRGLVTLDDTVGYSWHVLGLIARDEEDPQRAITYFRNCLNVEPERDKTRVALAETLRECGYHEDARELLLHFRRTPQSDSAAAERGRVLLERWEQG